MLRILLRTGLLGLCPGCEQQSMFTGFYDVPRECSACGLRYQVGDGAWLGAIAIGYGFGVIAAILAVFVELIWGPIRAAGLDPMWTIAVLGLVATALGYRPAKGIWFALLFRFGFMAWPDGTPSDGTQRLGATSGGTSS
jgi:uncharacterized protein (DUF983 family)